jgi:hypothetical protein
MQMPKIYEDIVNGLTQMTEGFVRDGVFVWNSIKDERPDDYRYWVDKRTPFIGHHAHFRKYMRKVAKELKRPFIHAEIGALRTYITGQGYQANPNFYAHLTIPRLVKTSPLSAALKLGATHVSGRYVGVDLLEQYTLCFRSDCKNDYFHFYGDDGKFIFENFLEQCRTNVKYRHALKLPLTPAKP